MIKLTFKFVHMPTVNIYFTFEGKALCVSQWLTPTWCNIFPMRNNRFAMKHVLGGLRQQHYTLNLTKADTPYTPGSIQINFY